MKESSFTDGHMIYVKNKALISKTGQQTLVQRSHWEVSQLKSAMHAWTTELWLSSQQGRRNSLLLSTSIKVGVASTYFFVQQLCVAADPFDLASLVRNFASFCLTLFVPSVF